MRDVIRTLALGILFLLPLLVVLLVVHKTVLLLADFVDRLSALFPRAMAFGPVVDTAVAVAILLLVALAAGLLARTRIGRGALARTQASPLLAFPPFSFLRALSASVAREGQEARVVLVPSDQGKTLAFLFADDGSEPVCVFVPSAPNWTSGQIAFARRADVEPTDLSFPEATRIIMQLGNCPAAARVGTGPAAGGP